MWGKKSKTDEQKRKAERDMKRQQDERAKEERWRRLEASKGLKTVESACKGQTNDSFMELQYYPAPTRRNPELLLSGYLSIQSGRWYVDIPQHSFNTYST